MRFFTVFAAFQCRARRLYVQILKHSFLGLALMAFIFSFKAAEAAGIKDLPSAIKISAAQSFNYAATRVDIMGGREKRSSRIHAFTKWSSMFARFDDQFANLNAQERSLLKTLEYDLGQMRSESLVDMAQSVNTYMNAKPYKGDSRNWGISDYWATPLEFLARGGDCEDFAIAKYTALRMLGVPEDHLRLAIVHDTAKDIPHAVLIVYTEDGPVLLDNQHEDMISARSEGRYRPIYSINRTAWWLHIPPKRTRLALVD